MTTQELKELVYKSYIQYNPHATSQEKRTVRRRIDRDVDAGKYDYMKRQFETNLKLLDGNDELAKDQSENKGLPVV